MVLAVVRVLAYGQVIAELVRTNHVPQATTSAGSISICLSTAAGFGQHFVLLGEAKMAEYLRVSIPLTFTCTEM